MVVAGIELDPRLPAPAAGVDYFPKMVSGGSENTYWSHAVGYQAELKLANTVAALPNEVVAKYGDAIGRPGSDIVSVNSKTGEVTMWDSKYRSAEVEIKQSSTFAKASTMENAIAEATEVISNSNLAPAIKATALRNLLKENYTTKTVGAGAVKNSVPQRYCGGKKC